MRNGNRSTAVDSRVTTQKLQQGWAAVGSRCSCTVVAADCHSGYLPTSDDNVTLPILRVGDTCPEHVDRAVRLLRFRRVDF
jgi:hypothetical protein